MKRTKTTIIKGVISLSKAEKKKLIGLAESQPSAVTACSRSSLADKLVKKLGIDYSQLPKLLEEASFVIAEDPVTRKAYLEQAS